MKTEKLNSSKFEAFRGNELQNLFQIIGGVLIYTRPTAEPGTVTTCDTHDTETDTIENPNNHKDTKDCDAVLNNGICEWVNTGVEVWYEYEIIPAYLPAECL